VLYYTYTLGRASRKHGGCVTNEGPLVSVIIPVYNAERFIAQTLESVAAQTYANFEVIVVDDGSSDGSRAAIEPFLADTRFKLIAQANAGISAARNTAIRASSGEFIALLDNDDLWLPQKLCKQIEIAAGNPETGMIFTNAELFGESGVIGKYYPDRASYPKPDILEHLLEENPFCAGTMMVRKSCLDDFGLFDETLPGVDDYEMWLRLALNGVKAAGTEEVLHRQRIHASSFSAGNHARMLRDSLALYERAMPMLDSDKHRQLLARTIGAKKAELAVVNARDWTRGGKGRRPGFEFLKKLIPEKARHKLLAILGRIISKQNR